jgi:hypothetical protein
VKHLCTAQWVMSFWARKAGRKTWAQEAAEIMCHTAREELTMARTWQEKTQDSQADQQTQDSTELELEKLSQYKMMKAKEQCWQSSSHLASMNAWSAVTTFGQSPLCGAVRTVIMFSIYPASKSGHSLHCVKKQRVGAVLAARMFQ